MNYMDVSRLVALLAGRTAADISQIQDEQSALPPPRKDHQGRAAHAKRLHSDQDSTPEKDVVQPTRGQLLAAKIGAKLGLWFECW
jgi:hypothetical protein